MPDSLHVLRRTRLYMDTVVDIQAVHDDSLSLQEAELHIQQAFEMFRQVELACSRFDADSELSIACRCIQQPVPLSPYLFEPLRFAIQLAEATEGLFDPCIGSTLIKQGFDRHYLTGERMAADSVNTSATYRDLILDEADRTLYIHQPLLVDLGAAAKGFAIDLAARQLQNLHGFLVNAGGDLYAGGRDHRDQPWAAGIQHPEIADELIHLCLLEDEALCTSGSYERRSRNIPGNHHIIRPDTMRSPQDLVSISLKAPYAMMADAFSTAAFLYGPDKGAAWIEAMGLTALFVTGQLDIINIGGF
ncbi:FAD:protein FMN transferase [Paenibacillus sp. JX-17]|uniref:FAD:protein FMN transferase n=1 Tax=Paenibacillus lacisoli TaxID=3064525 RepID=A0ABT9CAI8_9BACL|nr:FAD:protein FMN transferase [Paenibacillus sp. JX-17]MDO7906276.1 FAD:protein FMN transferase [Paenibacillus sp. JX-17]